MTSADPPGLVNPGTIAPPGPIGRLLRLVLGLLCLYVLTELLRYRGEIIRQPVSSLDNIALMALPPLFVLNAVINIGSGRNWGRLPLFVALGLLLLLAGIAATVTGTANHAIFGAGLWLFLVYFYTHLGVSFILAASFATPGCEMRALPDLAGRLRGRPANEHACPAFIAKIDEWERRRTDG